MSLSSPKTIGLVFLALFGFGLGLEHGALAGDLEDAYKELGLSSNATPEDAKRAYSDLAKKWSTEKNPGNELAARRLKRVESAWNIVESSFVSTAKGRVETLERLFEEFLKKPDGFARVLSFANSTNFKLRAARHEEWIGAVVNFLEGHQMELLNAAHTFDEKLKIASELGDFQKCWKTWKEVGPMLQRLEPITHTLLAQALLDAPTPERYISALKAASDYLPKGTASAHDLLFKGRELIYQERFGRSAVELFVDYSNALDRARNPTPEVTFIYSFGEALKEIEHAGAFQDEAKVIDGLNRLDRLTERLNEGPGALYFMQNPQSNFSFYSLQKDVQRDLKKSTDKFKKLTRNIKKSFRNYEVTLDKNCKRGLRGAISSILSWFTESD